MTMVRPRPSSVKIWPSAKDKEKGKFPVGIFLADETVVVSAVVAHKANVKVTPDLIATLLQANYNMDFVKIGFTPEGDKVTFETTERTQTMRVGGPDGDVIARSVWTPDGASAQVTVQPGDYLLAYCSTKLHWITRRAPFGVALLSDMDVDIDFSKETTEKDVVTIIATLPLTCNEQWQVMESGKAQLFKAGEPQ